MYLMLFNNFLLSKCSLQSSDASTYEYSIASSNIQPATSSWAWANVHFGCSAKFVYNQLNLRILFDEILISSVTSHPLT